MKLLYPNGLQSVILRVKIRDATSILDAGLTALTFASVGLIISTICENEATPTVYTQAAGTIETVTTLGTYAAPTATKCRFKLVDNTNHPGLYEIQFADARFAVASARSLVITITGPAALNLCQEDYEVQLADVSISQAAADKIFGASGAVLPELAQAAPAATPSPGAAMMLLYMALRNLDQVTATEKRITNNAGTVIAKKALSDDGTTYAEAEMVSGP